MTTNEMDQRVLEEAIQLIHFHTGITMHDQKKLLIQGRLRRRMRILNLETFEEYIQYLKGHKIEIEHFINAITTNETFFFRTARVWEQFNNLFLPEWYKNNPNSTLRIWSAASSSGEEAYTIAICCYEFKLKNPQFNFQIVGSDISTEVLNEARNAIYSGRAIESFRSENKALFERYLSDQGDGVFKVVDLLRKYVEFKEHNLFHTPRTINTYDIVFLRNVLIYFDGNDQEKVLSNIHKTLKSSGTLILGEADSLSRLKTSYVYSSPCFYKVGA